MDYRQQFKIYKVRVNPLTDDKILDQTKVKEFADDKFLSLMKMAESSQKALKTLWEKEKLLLSPQCF